VLAGRHQNVLTAMDRIRHHLPGQLLRGATVDALPEAARGMEFAAVWLDETAEITPEQWEFLRTRIR
jgi:hypothetical protein